MPIETPRPDGSLGPLYLAGALEAAGIEVDVLDASVGTTDDRLEDTFFNPIMQDNGLLRIGMTTERISEVIDRGGYNVVGVHSNFTPQTRMALAVAQAAKSVSRDILVIAGGVNARGIPERFMTEGIVDAICTTEGEKIIVNLIRAWENEKDISVPGTITMKGGKPAKNPLQLGTTITALDELPMPTWHKLPFAHYDRASGGGRAVLKTTTGRSASLMTSRGCPFRCKFCHISVERAHEAENGGIGTLRLKSVDRVMEEVRSLKQLGVEKIFFEDDSLLAHKSRVKEIFSHVRHMGLKIADVNGVNLVHFLKGSRGGKPTIDVEYLELLYSAGFDQIVFPVESASQRVLNTYATNKLRHDVLDVVELVAIAARVGITSPINMMIGFPDETEEEIISSIELGKRLVEAGAPYCTFFIPIPFPGSELYEMALRGGYLDPDFNTDELNWKNAVMHNTAVSPQRLMELRDWGWRYANTDEHVRTRLQASIGSRWESGKAA
jgi:radical SAM superfamily enzyme YgiQ (UPF0313 family)